MTPEELAQIRERAQAFGPYSVDFWNLCAAVAALQKEISESREHSRRLRETIGEIVGALEGCKIPVNSEVAKQALELRAVRDRLVSAHADACNALGVHAHPGISLAENIAALVRENRRMREELVALLAMRKEQAR